MLSPPEIPDHAIVKALRTAYGIRPTSLDFLPVGNDARAWSFRVETAADTFFLKLRIGKLNRASLLAPSHLQACGVTHAVAPLTASSGQLYACLDDFALILYPHIRGKSEWNMPLTQEQWRAWGGIMRRIHDAPLPAVIRREVFAQEWLDRLAKVEAAIGQGRFENEIARRMARIWRERTAEIALHKERCLALGSRLAEQNPPFVLCHADIHRANIILDAEGTIHIVDWDEALLAPKERDLMFFIDDSPSSDAAAAFMAGYGPAAIDPLALAYYKTDWVIQELADYGERVFLSAVSERELAQSLREFRRLFAPGDVVERAEQACARLAP